MDELDLITKTASEFCVRHGGAEVLRQRRQAQADDSALFQACVEQGFAGVALGSEFGGMDLGWKGLSTLLVEGGKQLIELPVLSAIQLPIETLTACPSGRLRDELIRRLGEGDLRSAVAWQSSLSHPSPYEPDVQAERRDGCWLLAGSSHLVLGAIAAHGFLVSAHSEQGLMIAWIEASADGLEVSAQSLMDHRNCGRLVLDGARIDDQAVLAQGHDAQMALDRLLDAGRLGLAAQMAGGASASFEQTLDYLKTRRQFGVAIGSFQALQHRIADVFIRLQLAQAALRIGVAQFDRGGADRARGAALAKAQCGQAYMLAAKEGVQMHGGIGVTDEHDMGFHLKSAQVGQALYGDASTCRSVWSASAGY